jgi:tRNA-splicing ligase RtcB
LLVGTARGLLSSCRRIGGDDRRAWASGYGGSGESDPALMLSVVLAEEPAVIDDENPGRQDKSMRTVSYVLAGEPGSLERSFGTTCHGAGRRLAWHGPPTWTSALYRDARACAIRPTEWHVQRST